MRIEPIFAAGALALALIAPAAGHIVLAAPTAAPGSYYAGFFRVGHGCDGKPTIKVRVSVPDSVGSARPQPKPGWTINIEHAALAEPATVDGKEVKDRVSAVTWSGRLEADQFDEFGLLMKLPKANGPLYFPTVQTCDGGEAAWTEVPADGQSAHDLKHPAPMLMLTAAADDPMAGMPGMGGDQPHAAPSTPAVTAGPLSVSDVSLPEVPGSTAALYLTISNSGAADRLIGGKSDLASAVEIHSMSMAGGTMEMRKLDAIDIPAGGSAVFDPNGNHIMLIGLNAPLRVGAAGTVTLTFEHQGEVAVPVVVTERNPGDGGHH